MTEQYYLTCVFVCHRFVDIDMVYEIVEKLGLQIHQTAGEGRKLKYVLASSNADDVIAANDMWAEYIEGI